MEKMDIEESVDSNLISLSNQEKTKIEEIYNLINSYLSNDSDKEQICNLLVKVDKIDFLSTLSYFSNETDSELLILLVQKLMVS